jgi:C4-dicarboxylate transporter
MKNKRPISMIKHTFLLLALAALLPSCASTQKRAYCGVAVQGNATLVPDSPQLQRKIDAVVAAEHWQSNLAGKKPNVVLLSVSEDLTIVDAITLFSAKGDTDINAAPLISLFGGGQPARVDLGKRKILPR